ncbi:MAG: hypothetical protein IJ489_10710 [Clostridia bacterium]|nr:hypothetical protein [Clostridia bacterium]
MKEKFCWKNVYLLALVPVVSVLLYLGMLMSGLLDTIGVLTVVFLVAMSIVWGACGFVFSRARVTLFHSVWIANLIPILTTAAYLILYVVYKFVESEALYNVTSIIGALGTGIFGVVGAVFYALAPFSLELLQVLISFIFQIIVFAVGYSIGASVGKKKKLAKKK